MNELTTEKMMTTKELAEYLNVSERTITDTAKKIGVESTFAPFQTSGGIQKKRVYTEAQATAIKLELQKHHNITDRTAIDTIGNDLEGELLVQKAMAYQQQKIEMLQSQVNTMTPKAIAYDEYVDRGKFCNFRDSANYLGVRQTDLMALLNSGYIYKNSMGEYRCYAEYNEYFALRPYTRGETTRQQLMLTMKGLEYFGKKLGARNGEVDC